MVLFEKGKYRVRLAETEADVRACQKLRHAAFSLQGRGGVDEDDFDSLYKHVLIETPKTNTLLGCFRILPLATGAEISGCYGSQFYDLSGLEAIPSPMLELGRFCVDPSCDDPDVIRVAWAAITSFVDEQGITFLFGCSSFVGNDPERYRDAFLWLRDNNTAKGPLAPKRLSQNRVDFETLTGQGSKKQATLDMPPLLKTYLLMGGWVSDHAVIDPDMNTMHVFTGVEIDKIPESRKRLLRALT